MNRQYGALSGVATVLIVLNHAIHFGFQLSPVEGGWLYALTAMQALGAFAVPAFLFISGAFLSYSAGRLSLAFIANNVGRVLWPYLIWSCVFYVLVLSVDGDSYSFFGYVKNLLVGYPYHFIPLLIFWYVASPIVVKVGRRHWALLLVAVALYQVFLLALRYPQMFGTAEMMPGWARLFRVPVLSTPMSDWAIYFPAGLVFSMHDAALKPRLFRLRWVAVASAAGLFLLGMLDAFDVVVAPWARFAAPVPALCLLPVVSHGRIPQVRRLEFLGKRSYGVYLVHFAVLSLLASAMDKRHLNVDNLSLAVFPFFLAVALTTPILLMGAMTRTEPTRKAFRYVFGFVPPVAEARRK